MKLSQMTTDQVADAMIQIAPDIETLMNDAELVNKFKSRPTSTDTKEAMKLGTITVLNIAMYLLKEQRQVTWNILGALNQKTSEEIGKQLFPTTIKQITEILKDPEFLSFFPQFAQSGQGTQSDY